MKTLRRFLRRMAGPFTRHRDEARLTQEVEEHLALQTAENMRLGMAPDQARRQAVLKFGAVEAVKERYRDERRVPFFEQLYQDTRYALRSLRRSPCVTAVAVVTLALGIGLATAFFSVLDAVLLRPLPWREPERLVSIWIVRPEWRSNPLLSRSWAQGMVSWPNFRDLNNLSQVLKEVAVWRRAQQIVVNDTHEVTTGMVVSSTFLPMLGTRLHAGRAFSLREDEEPTDSVIISFETWQRRFGGDENILGVDVILDNARRTIVGVLPSMFRFEGAPAPLEFLLPFGNEPAANRTRTNHAFSAIGRLKFGVTLEDALRDLEPILREGQKPEQRTARVEFLVDTQLGSSRLTVWTLFSAAGLLLLIACANVAGLLLGQAETRQQDVAIRAALGASRVQLVREQVVESFLLALVGTACGLIVVRLLTPVLVALAPPGIPRLESVSVNARVLLFSVAVTCLTTLLFGMFPALVTSRQDPIDAVRQGRHRGLGRHRLRNALLTAEVALAFVLLIGSALLGETLIRLKAEPLGFEAENLVAVSVRPLPDTPSSSLRVLEERLTALPGVQAAGGAASVPFLGGFSSNLVDVDGHQTQVAAFHHQVTLGYFGTLRLQLLKGRYFAPLDAGGEPVAIVSRSFEQQYLGGTALNRRLRFNRKSNVWYRVVGVVTDAKQLTISGDIGPAFYLLNDRPTQFVLRTTDPETLMRDIRGVVRSHDSRLIVTNVQAMQQLVDRTIAPQTFLAALASLFGGTAFVLAIVGIFALLSRSATDRRAEFGLRVALGAVRSDVLRLVAFQGGLPVLAGIALGTPAAFVGARLISSLLYGVTPTAAHTFLSVAAVLFVASVIAMAWPAYRATRVDPLVALRYE